MESIAVDDLEVTLLLQAALPSGSAYRAKPGLVKIESLLKGDALQAAKSKAQFYQNQYFVDYSIYDK